MVSANSLSNNSSLGISEKKEKRKKNASCYEFKAEED